MFPMEPKVCSLYVILDQVSSQFNCARNCHFFPCPKTSVWGLYSQVLSGIQ